jgi:hypothetical protein
MRTNMPGRLELISAYCCSLGGGTYTVSSSTKSSFRGSFMTLSQRCLTRNATFAASPDSSLAGRARSYFFWLANNISRPPLWRLSEGYRHGSKSLTYLNSIVIGMVPSFDISAFDHLQGAGDVRGVDSIGTGCASSAAPNPTQLSETSAKEILTAMTRCGACAYATPRPKHECFF